MLHQARAAVGTRPPSLEWTACDEIAEVLHRAGMRGEQFNHLYLPTGGGLDLAGARRSRVEPGCIELVFSKESIDLVRPERLLLNIDWNEPLWSYFWLEGSTLPPSGVYPGDHPSRREELCEVSPGDYRDSSTWDADFIGHDGDGEPVPLPRTARRVTRWLSDTRFLLVCKSSPYNRIPRTYDGRHELLAEPEFREVMTRGAAGDLEWLTATAPRKHYA